MRFDPNATNLVTVNFRNTHIYTPNFSFLYNIRQRCPPSKVTLHQRLSSIKGCPPSKCLPSKDLFHQRSSSVKGCLPSKVVFRQRLSTIKDYLPSKVVFRQRSSSIKGRLPSKLVLQNPSCNIAYLTMGTCLSACLIFASCTVYCVPSY